VRFLVIGDGHLREELEEKAREWKLSHDVDFLGTRNDPENFYPALDVVALTSLNEGTPLTLIEAMANARAVIATEVGGVVDLLGGPLAGESSSRPEEKEPAGFLLREHGVGVRPNDADAFACALARIIADEEYRRAAGVRGESFVEQNYTRERLLRDIKNLYQGLSGEVSASKTLDRKSQVKAESSNLGT
jgi:glycosyltransferase involved in cell wall biosynthesis